MQRESPKFTRVQHTGQSIVSGGSSKVKTTLQ